MSAAKIRTGPAPSLASDRAETRPPAYVYMLRCDDGSLYSGWTNDLARRVKRHVSGAGAKYTRAHHGAALAYAERCDDKSAALKREAALKKLTKQEKERLAADWQAAQRITLRMATPDDAAAVQEIYGWYVTHSTATSQYDVPTVEDYRAFIADTLRCAPFILAIGGDGRLRGYACAHIWRTRQAYAWDAETTIYCAPNDVGLGVGRRLYKALLALLKAQGYHNAFALVTVPNPASEAFHRSLGFKRYGLERHTGYKFGCWLGLGYWQYVIDPSDDAPAAVRYTLPEDEVREILKGI